MFLRVFTPCLNFPTYFTIKNETRHAVQAKAMNPAFSKIAPVSGGPVDLVMRANSLKPGWQRAGVGISHRQRARVNFVLITYHILSVLHLGDKPIFQLAEAAFRSSSSWILGSDFLLPSRAPFAAIWSNASCDFCGDFRGFNGLD